MANSDDENPDRAEDFGTFLTDFADGSPAQVLSKRWRELVAACRETGGKGTMSIKLSIKPEGTRSVIKIESKTIKPEHPMPSDVYFTDEGGSLFKEDPRQLKLPGKIIDASAGVPRIVPSRKD